MKKIVFIILSVFINTSILFSQEDKKIDSLYQIVNTTKNDSIKVSVLNKLAFKFIFNDAVKAKKLLKQSEQIAISKKIEFGYNELVNIKGIFNDIEGKKDSALFYFNKALALSKKNKFTTIEARSTNNLGMYHWNNGSPQKAIAFFFSALKTNEILPIDKQTNSSVYLNNIGLIYQEMNLFEKALEYHKKSYQIRVQKKLIHDQISSLNNMGVCYRWLKKYDLSLQSFIEGENLCISNNIKTEYYKILENMGNLYSDQSNHNKALELYLKSEKNIDFATIQSNSLLNVYSSISSAYNQLNSYKKGLFYAEKGLEIYIKEPNLKTYCSDLFKVSAQSYFATGNFQKGNYYNTLFYELQDELFSDKNSKSLAELETKYQTTKKEKLILEKEQELTKKNNQIIIASIIALSFLLLGFLIYKNQKTKNKHQHQQAILREVLLKIESENQLQEQRLDISKELHDNIGSQLTFVISAIDTLKQNYPSTNEKIDHQLENINSFTKNTITELRDTVWVMNIKEIDGQALKERLLDNIERAKMSHPNIDFKITITDFEIQNHIAALNIHRTIQEAVNNALKYANATEIEISISEKDNQIIAFVNDNGKGFDVETTKKRNGLKNMRKRMQAINGVFEINSHQNNGTTITLTIPKTV